MVSLFIFPKGTIALDSEPRGRRYGKNMIYNMNRNILCTLKNEPLNIMLLHTSRRMDGHWTKTVPVVSHIFDVSSSTGLEIGGYLTSCVSYFLRISFHGARNRGLSYLLERWIRKPHPRIESSKYAPTESFGGGYITSPLLLATGSYALALGPNTKPRHPLLDFRPIATEIIATAPI